MNNGSKAVVNAFLAMCTLMDPDILEPYHKIVDGDLHPEEDLYSSFVYKGISEKEFSHKSGRKRARRKRR